MRKSPKNSVNQQAEKPTSSRHQESYWATAREECGLDSTLTLHACFIRIEHFWRKIGNLVDEFGAKKYPQLAKPAQYVMETALLKEDFQSTNNCLMCMVIVPMKI